MNKEDLIKELQLEPCLEGGHFARTYTSPFTATVQLKNASSPKERAHMSTIFYLLTDESPINFFNKNSADIMHYFQLGLPIRYHTVAPDGQCSTAVLGPDILAGQRLQLMVPAGYWKAAELITATGAGCNGSPESKYGLLSEAVTPEFNYEDWSMATVEEIRTLVPKDWEKYEKFIKPVGQR